MGVHQSEFDRPPLQLCSGEVLEQILRLCKKATCRGYSGSYTLLERGFTNSSRTTVMRTPSRQHHNLSQGTVKLGKPACDFGRYA